MRSHVTQSAARVSPVWRCAACNNRGHRVVHIGPDLRGAYDLLSMLPRVGAPVAPSAAPFDLVSCSSCAAVTVQPAEGMPQ